MTLKVKQTRLVAMLATYLILSLAAILYAVPFAWLVLNSFKTPDQIFKIPLEWLPRPWVLSNYVDSWNAQPFAVYYRNSVIVTVASILGAVVSCTLAGYGFARLEFVGKKLIFIVVIGVMILPSQVTIIPLFLIFKTFGALNTRWPLIIPYFLAPPFFIFLLRQFFASIPNELEDAATIDGCSTFGILWKIIMPVSKPAMTSVAIFVFRNTWNDFFTPLLYLTSKKKFTVPLGLMWFRNDFFVEWHLLMAATVLAIAPGVIMFFSLQRYFVEGITLTGIKG